MMIQLDPAVKTGKVKISTGLVCLRQLQEHGTCIPVKDPATHNRHRNLLLVCRYVFCSSPNNPSKCQVGEQGHPVTRANTVRKWPKA